MLRGMKNVGKTERSNLLSLKKKGSLVVVLCYFYRVYKEGEIQSHLRGAQ